MALQSVRLIEIVGKSIYLEDYIMDKYIYDENNGLWYELVEDNYIPCLTLPLEENKPIGIWGATAPAVY